MASNRRQLGLSLLSAAGSPETPSKTASGYWKVEGSGGGGGGRRGWIIVGLLSIVVLAMSSINSQMMSTNNSPSSSSTSQSKEAMRVKQRSMGHHPLHLQLSAEVQDGGPEEESLEDETDLGLDMNSTKLLFIKSTSSGGKPPKPNKFTKSQTAETAVPRLAKSQEGSHVVPKRSGDASTKSSPLPGRSGAGSGGTSAHSKDPEVVKAERFLREPEPLAERELAAAEKAKAAKVAVEKNAEVKTTAKATGQKTTAKNAEEMTTEVEAAGSSAKAAMSLKPTPVVKPPTDEEVDDSIFSGLVRMVRSRVTPSPPPKEISPAEEEEEESKPTVKPTATPAVKPAVARASAVSPKVDTCEAPTCYCTTKDIPCRRQYCKSKVRWPVSPPPMAALGMPVQASDSPTKTYSIVEFIRHSNLGIPQGIVKSELPTPKDIFRGVNFTQKSCAIIGNSGVLQMTKYGKQIDAHDIVIRMNQAPTKGYEPIVGSRTSIRLLNALWSMNYGKAYKRRELELPLEKDITFITSRGEFLVRNFKALYASMKASRPDVKVYMIQHKAVSRTKMLLAVFRNCLQHGGKEYDGGRVPSSGLVSVFALKDVCSSLTAYGFGSHSQAKYQYYVLHGTQRSVGNPTHSFTAENALIRAMAYEKLITLCGPKGCIGAPLPPAVLKVAKSEKNVANLHHS